MEEHSDEQVQQLDDTSAAQGQPDRQEEQYAPDEADAALGGAATDPSDGAVAEDAAPQDDEVVVEDVQEQSAGDEEAPGEAEPELDPAGVVEAILFAADSALTPARIGQIAKITSQRRVKEIIRSLNEKYEQALCAFRVDAIAGGFRMLTLPLYHNVLGRLYKARNETKLTAASLETLSIVAYKQPILRADIEAIRGVASGEVLRSLMERQLVKIVGRAEIVGRPMLYGTTKRFLELFGLAGLEDLPKGQELRNLWTDPKPPAAVAAATAAAEPTAEQTAQQPAADGQQEEPATGERQAAPEARPDEPAAEAGPAEADAAAPDETSAG